MQFEFRMNESKIKSEQQSKLMVKAIKILHQVILSQFDLADNGIPFKKQIKLIRSFLHFLNIKPK